MNTLNALAVVVLLQVTIITLVAAIAIRFSMRRAALRHAIGVLALAFILASPAIALLLPKSPWLGGVSQTAEMAEVAAMDRSSIDAAFDEIVESRPIRGSSEVVVEPAASRAETQETSVGEPPSTVGLHEPASRSTGSFAAIISSWLPAGFALALWAWAAGIVIYGLRFVVQRRQLRLLASSIKREPIKATLVDQACRVVGLEKHPTIGVSDLAPMPFVLGCWKPVIVLPSSLVETGSESRLREVLIHEFAHVVRRDPWVNAAQHLARVGFWLHPGVHWLNRQIARSREEVCDNFVLARTNSADYAQTLLELAESCGSARFGLSLLGMFLPRWNLESRILDILNPNRNKSTRTSRKSVAIIALMFGAVCAVIGGIGISAPYAQDLTAQPTTSPEQDSEAKAEPAAQDLKKITVRGQCVDQDSLPIGACRARVFRCQPDNKPPVLLADVEFREGRFSIPDIEVQPANFLTIKEGLLLLVVTADGYSTWTKPVAESKADEEQVVELSSDIEVLSGFVANENGRPVKDAKVFLQTGVLHYIPDCKSAVTNEQGIFRIPDLRRFNPEEHTTFDPKTRITTMVGSTPIYISHPDYALTQAEFSRVPESITVGLLPPATIEGRVIDDVTGEPIPDVMVFAEGIARFDSLQTTTDGDGKYRIRANKDHYNLWAEADDRIAIAAKAIAVTPGQKVENIDIHMVDGATVVGTVIDEMTKKPVESAPPTPFYVRHQGPARPVSGQSSTAALVEPNGTFRMRVSPGKNYLFDRSNNVLGTVDVQAGEEVKLDLRTVEGRTADSPVLADPDFKLFQRLFAEAQKEDRTSFPKVKPKQEPSAPRQPSQLVPPPREEVIPSNRQRQDTPVGKLLNQIEQQNRRELRFKDDWLKTLKSIVDLGPAAVPELIQELDTTNDDMMIRCCAFALRAIGDKRAVPALIRAIPKGLRPVRSDMGCKANDPELGRWAAANDNSADTLDEQRYMFGQAKREIFSALNVLTEQQMGERELNWVDLDGTQLQQHLKQELFYCVAKRYADWWEQNGVDFTQEPEYASANLPEFDAKPLIAPAANTNNRTDKDRSGSILESVFNPKAVEVFLDLDTGRVAGLPQKWRDAKNIEPVMDEIVEWAAGEGFDVMGTEFDAPDGQRHYALRPIGLRAWELSETHWKMKSDDISIDDLQAEGRFIDDFLLHFDDETQSIDPKATAPIFYMTREGTPGLLFVGVEVKDDSAKGGTPYDGGDLELMPIHFVKGRRFGSTGFVEVK